MVLLRSFFYSTARFIFSFIVYSHGFSGCGSECSRILSVFVLSLERPMLEDADLRKTQLYVNLKNDVGSTIS